MSNKLLPTLPKMRYEWRMTQYHGDINPEYGGYLWRIAYQDQSVCCVDITEIVDGCGSFMMSQPILIGTGSSVNIPTAIDQSVSALDCIGINTDSLLAHTPMQRFHILLDAHKYYGQYVDYSPITYAIRMSIDGKDNDLLDDSFWRDHYDPEIESLYYRFYNASRYRTHGKRMLSAMVRLVDDNRLWRGW